MHNYVNKTLYSIHVKLFIYFTSTADACFWTVPGAPRGTERTCNTERPQLGLESSQAEFMVMPSAPLQVLPLCLQ